MYKKGIAEDTTKEAKAKGGDGRMAGMLGWLGRLQPQTNRKSRFRFVVAIVICLENLRMLSSASAASMRPAGSCVVARGQ